MGHLHAENIIHRDLAGPAAAVAAAVTTGGGTARNILLDKGGNAKVSDFGLSRRLSEIMV